MEIGRNFATGWLEGDDAGPPLFQLCQSGSLATASLASCVHSSGVEKRRYMVRGGMPSRRAACSLFPAHCSMVASTNRFVASRTVVPMGMETLGAICVAAGSGDGPETFVEK